MEETKVPVEAGKVLMKYLLGDTSGIDKDHADVDNDGSVDILDLIRFKSARK